MEDMDQGRTTDLGHIIGDIHIRILIHTRILIMVITMDRNIIKLDKEKSIKL